MTLSSSSPLEEAAADRKESIGPFLRQQWYAAAWDDEISPGAPLARVILGEPVLIWRSSDGSVSALADICPHRWAPLSAGRVDDTGVRCGYHGLRFDRTGRCAENPHGPVLASLHVHAYPLISRHGMIWIWMGDAASKADPDAIPDLGFVDRTPPTALIRGYLYTKAGHHLLEDIIL